jgi:hypothetical protein
MLGLDRLGRDMVTRLAPLAASLPGLGPQHPVTIHGGVIQGHTPQRQSTVKDQHYRPTDSFMSPCHLVPVSSGIGMPVKGSGILGLHPQSATTGHGRQKGSSKGHRHRAYSAACVPHEGRRMQQHESG